MIRSRLVLLMFNGPALIFYCYFSTSLLLDDDTDQVQQADEALTSKFQDFDIVSMKNSLPEKVLQHLHPLWKDVYHTGCCEDVYINVRTSLQTQERRLPVILTTWMQT